MRTIKTATILLGLIGAILLGSGRPKIEAVGQRGQRPATPPVAPQFVAWPLPTSGKAYGTIDGKHLWRYVKEQAEIAEHYRDPGPPAVLGSHRGHVERRRGRGLADEEVPADRAD